MVIFRGQLLRRTIATVFLLTGFFAQVQTVFACEILDGTPRSVCCCGEQMADGCAMGGGCAMPTQSPSTDCCEVSVEKPASLSATGPVTQSHTVMLLDAPQPPLAVLPTPFTPIDPSLDIRSILYRNTSLVWLAGTQTYLVTSRLRI